MTRVTPAIGFAPLARWAWAALACAVAFGGRAAADDAYDPAAKRWPLLSDSPWASARAAGMGEAMGGSADMQDAPYYNPAGLGGLYPSADSEAAVTGVYFPYLGFASRGPFSLDRELSPRSAGANRRLAAANAAALRDGGSYARYSVVPAVHVRRFFVAYSYDYQVGAQDVGRDAAGRAMLRFHEREAHGPHVGFSGADPQNRVIFGLSAHQRHWREAQGEGMADGITDPKNATFARQALQGTSANAGLTFRYPTKWLMLQWYAVGRDVGGTKMVGEGGDAAGVTIREDVTSGVGVFRHWSQGYTASANAEGAYLTDRAMPSARKWRAGAEFLVGERQGMMSGLGFRLGWRDAGPSFGVHANMGLVGLGYAWSAEDVGSVGKRVIEQRGTGLLSINVAE